MSITKRCLCCLATTSSMVDIEVENPNLGQIPVPLTPCSLSFTELCALYAVTDVALVTSLRDGMNLVRSWVGSFCFFYLTICS